MNRRTRSYETRTRRIATSLLRRILSISDTYDKHSEIQDYRPFLQIQLDILKRIINAEKTIRKLRGRQRDPTDIESYRCRRKLLLFLGSTLAWFLLEFNRRYIRLFEGGRGPGFISGKKGLELEVLALKTAFELEGVGAVLHDITHSLLRGDISLIGPNGVKPLEVKAIRNKRRPDRREMRQKRILDILMEFYYTGTSERLHPGHRAIGRTLREHDKHNWNQLSQVLSEAVRSGHATLVVDKCFVYHAFKGKPTIDGNLIDILRSWRPHHWEFGCNDRLISGLPSVIPFTCFDISTDHKEALLLGDLGYCVFLNYDVLMKVLGDRGLHCERVEDQRLGTLRVTFEQDQEGPATVVGGIIDRLLYEGLSLDTYVYYTKTGLALGEKMLSEVDKR